MSFLIRFFFPLVIRVYITVKKNLEIGEEKKKKYDNQILYGK